MLKPRSWIQVIAFTAVLSLAGSLAAYGGHGHRGMPEDASTFDFCELADGETKVFGDGEHGVTAKRVGDVVSVELPGDSEHKNVELALDGETCPKLVYMLDDTHKMFFIKHEDGDHHERIRVHLKSSEDCKGHGCSRKAVFVGDDHDVKVVDMDGSGFAWASAHGDMMKMDKDSITLACPKGDTHMTIKKDEMAGPYNCPRHFEELKKVKARRMIKHIVVETDHDEDH